MSFERLSPLVKKSGSPLSVQEFHSRVNIVFHNYEAAQYDALHVDMWESLQEQMDLLVHDWFSKTSPKAPLKLLDIGCGTGLSTQKLLNTPVGPLVESIVLLDTSPKMLEQAQMKAAHWDKPYTVINGTIADLTGSFDVVIICSVLHHIPDLDTFIRHIDALLNPGGVIIHLQDPNGDYAQDNLFKEREKEFERLQAVQKVKRITDYFPKSIKHKINLFLGRKNYIDLINDALIREKTIKKRLTADEIWSVTDIHVESKNDSQARGISFAFLKQKLQNFTLLSHRSYGFYGVLKNDLPSTMQANESQWITENQLNGRNLACVWQKQ